MMSMRLSFAQIRTALLMLALMLVLSMPTDSLLASGKEKPQDYKVLDYDRTRAPLDRSLNWDEADARSSGCITCHASGDHKTMHASPAVILGCTDCHGGDPSVTGDNAWGFDSMEYMAALTKAHVLPKYPASWEWPKSANPKRSYALIAKESPEFVRFINPSDYRVVRDSCGDCHIKIIEASERSLMSTGAMLWGGAAYNNGIVPFKNYMFGESFTRDGKPAMIKSPDSTGQGNFGTVTEAEKARGALPVMYPLPMWHTIPPGDVFRVFERGGRNITPQFPEIGLPNIGGTIQRLEEPGRPDLRQSNRGPATGLRVAIPVLNIHKTRLNDPFLWQMGTNDQPGDYRSSGCAACHVVYANDREPRHSMNYAQCGRDGQTVTADPTINRLREGQSRKGAYGDYDAAAHHGDGHGEGHGDGHHADAAHGKDQSEICREAIAAPSQLAGHGNPHGADTGAWPNALFNEGELPPIGLAEKDYKPKPQAHDAEVKAAHAVIKDSVPMDERERGHPLVHAFTRAIPTAQCMNCHMHQPNIFLNTYLGYIMWDYESDAPSMWPGPENITPRPDGLTDAEYQRIYMQQRYPTAAEVRKILDRNPEAASAHGLWGDIDFLRNVYDLNATLRDTQFADYHGHGWNFRAIFKRDRRGNLLDEDGNMATYGTEKANIVSPDDPEKFRKADEGKFVKAGVNPGKAVHMMDIHAEKGMQCADCHFAQDSHGNGLIYGEVANAVEIGCKDCHGTADAYPTLMTSNLAAPPEGNNLSLLRNPDGQRRFEWMRDSTGRRVLLQRSIIDPDTVWRVSLVKDSVDRASSEFNPKAARAKLMAKSASETGEYKFGTGIAKADRAHNDEEMLCFTCHLSWTTSCAGCHLPIEANWKSGVHKYEEDETRNYATYNPQVARDEMFQLGRHQTTKGNVVAPIRSTSALILSSTNINRERIYIQQPPISSIGYSSQAFAPHFPHTVRTQETKTCSDCHVSANEDNNAVMSQLLLLGTNFVNFVGMNAWVGLDGGFEAVRVTEWEEPQAVIGSYLHRYAYPDFYKLHVEQNNRELKNWSRGAIVDDKLSGETTGREEFHNVVQGTKYAVRCLQMRGEYMFVAEGRGGFRAYDIASVGNKGFSERVIKAPFSSIGHNTHIKTKNATCMAIPTNQAIAPERNTPELREVNQEQPFAAIYHYAFVTDSVEGLIAVNVDTLADGEFRNNFFKRTFTFNPDGVLTGARHITLAGNIAYITADAGLVVVDLARILPEGERCEVKRDSKDQSCLDPKVTAVIPMQDARASAVQFRYLWVTDAQGLKLFDVTELAQPVAVPEGTVPLADARRVFLSRTYAYVAAKQEGVVIVDITRPRAPQIYDRVTLDGQLNDAEDVMVASTNATLFAYVADGRNGFKVLQLTAPDTQPNFYGFAPEPKPHMIAWTQTPSPALALSKGLDRDRGVDETGGQIAIFGRLGSRPFNRKEMEGFFLNSKRQVYRVRDDVNMADWVGAMPTSMVRN